MHYVSTRDTSLRYTPAQAIAQGLSREGGLFVPAVLPRFSQNALTDLRDMTYQQRAVYVMNLFLEDYGAAEISAFARRAYGPDRFDTPEVAPLRPVGSRTCCLELWHGPTCAFKDMALQMLPQLLSAALQKNQEKRTACILVATSGDTGKAALEGFRDVEQTRILVFYPKDGVSEMQQLQMVTQEGDNVGVCAIKGNFDAAQTGVKAIFSDGKLREELSCRGYFLSSANSINWGRVLPQIVYYISAYCDLLKADAIQPGDKVNFCVPTGNFGNILAAWYAREMGLPVGRLICASNSNNVLTDFIRTGLYDKNRPFYNTISPSMDILISSNLERLLYYLCGQDPRRVAEYMEELGSTGRYQLDESTVKKLQQFFAAGCATEEETRETIAGLWKKRRYLIDPHTAVAFHVLSQYRRESGDRTPTVVVSTASPYKFCGAVLEALGETGPARDADLPERLAALTGVPIPAPLAALRDKKIRFTQWVEPEQMEQTVGEFLP